jgi:hypothetical protein
MSETTPPDEPQEHAVEACYSGGPGVRYYMPCMLCSCGWTSGRCDTFEEAGALLDEHLEEVKADA